MDARPSLILFNLSDSCCWVLFALLFTLLSFFGLFLFDSFSRLFGAFPRCSNIVLVHNPFFDNDKGLDLHVRTQPMLDGTYSFVYFLYNWAEILSQKMSRKSVEIPIGRKIDLIWWILMLHLGNKEQIRIKVASMVHVDVKGTHEEEWQIFETEAKLIQESRFPQHP